MRLVFSFFLALTTYLPASRAVEFINPPAPGATDDFSLNAVYVEGSILNVQWTPAIPNVTELTMFQLNGTQWLPGLEYVARDIPPLVTSYGWTVQTNKSLEVSPMFFINIFIEGATQSEANSHYFNITTPNGEDHSQSSSSTSTSSSSSLPTSLAASTMSIGSSQPTSSAIIGGAVHTTNTPAQTSTPAPTTMTSSALSVGGKVGIGVGVSAAVILGLVAGWFIFGRSKKRDQVGPLITETPDYYYSPPKMQAYPSQLDGETTQVRSMHELPGHNS